MARIAWIPQVYGYVVCLISVVTVLISVNNVVNAAFDLSDPLHSRDFRGMEANLASFELYRADMLSRGAMTGRPTPVAPERAPTWDEPTLRAMYDAARADRIRGARIHALRSLVGSGLLLVVAFLLFVTHWAWLRRQARAAV